MRALERPLRQSSNKIWLTVGLEDISRYSSPFPLIKKIKSKKLLQHIAILLASRATLPSLTKERLRRTATKIKDENPLLAGDLGFRVFKLDSSNIRPWDLNRENFKQRLLDNVEHIEKDRSEEDLLYELLLEFGLDLCLTLEKRDIAGKRVNVVDRGVLITCLAEQIDQSEVEELALGIAALYRQLENTGRYRGRFSRQCFCGRRRQNQPHRNFAAVRHQRRTQFIGRTMKFQFEPDLDYQRKAIDAVCDLFRGQEACRSEFTASHALTEQGQLGFAENALGVGNRLALSEDALLANLQDIQLRNGLRPSSGLDSHDFSVEMETGTGKTYVYLRTIFELNKRYGFTKFAIVVPSIAIKEGVDKSLAMMRDHFRALYSGAPFEHFIYDSTQLGQVRNFATSPQIQIMVMTVGAINKRNINSIYHESEKTGGEKPIDLVRATHPILIVDEPQSVDGGLKGRGKEALETMNPLCTLRYSATHIDLHHPVYRLNAVDAYERKLVKQIEVSAGTVIDDYNRPYVRLVATRRQRGVISAPS